MYLRTYQNPAPVYEAVTEGMPYLFRRYDHDTCPVFRRTLHLLEKRQARALLVRGLQFPETHLMCAFQLVQPNQLVIDFVLSSITLQQRDDCQHEAHEIPNPNPRPWVVAEYFRDWFHVWFTRGVMVYLAIPENNSSTFATMRYIAHTTKGPVTKKLWNGELHTFYCLTQDSCHKLIVSMFNDFKLPGQEASKELIKFHPQLVLPKSL